LRFGTAGQPRNDIRLTKVAIVSAYHGTEHEIDMYYGAWMIDIYEPYLVCSRGDTLPEGKANNYRVMMMHK
jgi:hypothetical protein